MKIRFKIVKTNYGSKHYRKLRKWFVCGAVEYLDKKGTEMQRVWETVYAWHRLRLILHHKNKFNPV